MRKPFIFSFVVLASLANASCSMILNHLPGVYTIDVQQGNIVDQEMVDQLRPGMSKRQVLYIMGSPMLKDPFHDNYWEYLYSNQPGGEDRKQKRITLIFDGDKIVGLNGDFKPGKHQPMKASADQTVDVPKRNLDESLWGVTKAWFAGESGDAQSRERRERDEKALKDESKGVWEKFSGWATGESAEPEKSDPDKSQEPAPDAEKSKKTEESQSSTPKSSDQ